MFFVYVDQTKLASSGGIAETRTDHITHHALAKPTDHTRPRPEKESREESIHNERTNEHGFKVETK